MSTISSLITPPVTAASSTSAATAANPLAGMTTGDFLKIMMSELQNQDPTQPEDSSQLLSEISNLQNVQSQVSLQQQLQSMVTQNQLAAAGGLIGREVAGVNSNNNQVQGIVTSVLVQNGTPMLQLDSGQSLSMSNVTTIGPAATSSTTTTGTTPTTGTAATPGVVPGTSAILPPLTTTPTTGI